MKLLLLNANRVGKGTYHRALGFGRELARRGHDATMMTVSKDERFRPQERLDASGLRIVECPCLLDELLPWHASGPLDIGLRLREIAFGRYDAVYAFEYQPNVSGPVFLTRFWKRFTLLSDWCDWHAGASYRFGGRKWAHRIDRVFEEFIRHRADHLTVICETLRQRALSLGIPSERISLIREGVDPDYIRPLDRNAARSRLGIPLDAAVIGTISDASEAFQLLFDTVGLLAEEFPQIRLLVVGQAPLAPQRLRGAPAGLERLVLPGRVADEDLPWYLACADVLALPLEDTLINRGRWPHKLGDMAAAARPVVTSPGGEFPAWLGTRGAAAVVPFAADAFATAIGRLMRAHGEAAPLAERARRVVMQELSWSRIGAQVADMVEHSVAARSRART